MIDLEALAGGPHVVLGAGGATGAAIVRELVWAGRRVRAVTRGGRGFAGPGVMPPALYEDCAADVTDRDAVRRAVEGAAVVYQCACPSHDRGARGFAVVTRLAAAAAAEAGARLVVLDDLSACGAADGPIREAAPPAPSTSAGRRRAALAAELLAASSAGRLRVVIARSSDHFGPEETRSPLGARFFRALLRGEVARWPLDLDQPHTVHYVPDVARACILLGDSDRSEGRVWHLPAPPPVTGRDFIALAAAAAGLPARPATLRPWAALLLGRGAPDLRAIPGERYRWERPFVCDAPGFEAAFASVTTTPLEQALAGTVAWYRASRPGGRRKPALVLAKKT